MDERLPTGGAQLGRLHRGLWTRREALAVTTAGVVDGFVRRGEWRTIWPGFMTDAGTVLDHGQRAHAAALVCGVDAVVCGRTAARLHGLPLLDDHHPSTGAQDHLLDDVMTSGSRRTPHVRDADGSVRVLRRYDRTARPGTQGRRWWRRTDGATGCPSCTAGARRG